MINELHEKYSVFKNYIEQEKYDEAKDSFELLDKKLRQIFESKNSVFSNSEINLLIEIDKFLTDNLPSLSNEKKETQHNLSKLTKGRSGVNAYIGNTKK